MTAFFNVTCLQAKNTDKCLFDSLNLSFSKKGYKYIGSSLSSLNVGLILPHSSHLSFYVETRICSNNWKPNSGPFAQKTAL